MIAAFGTNVYITWTSNSIGPYEAYVAVSHNNGTTFTVTNLSGNFIGARKCRFVSSSNGTDVYVTYRNEHHEYG